MRIMVTGSLAFDHLLTFPGLIADQIIRDQAERISLSLLADSMTIRRGGVAANIALGLRRLGVHAIPVGAVGLDFGDYRSWLADNDVDLRALHTSTSRHTARFLCTSDLAGNQLATFYPGAMTEAAQIALPALVDAYGPVDLVLISPDDPDAMLRHTRECRRHGYRFAADPSQQLATLGRDDIRELVEGAHLLFSNEYERSLLLEKSGWAAHEVSRRVAGWVTTDGPDGVRVERPGRPTLHVPSVAGTVVVDPTGGGDAFRAGFLAGLSWGLGDERAAQVGCGLAAVVLEHPGAQEYRWDPDGFLDRLAGAYGGAAAADIRTARAERAPTTKETTP
ncbi:carbohydrate kinase family protein [Micromonospora sp. NPDC049101]|uniref:carbohydrate kinase family protein n=1 Tax=unclassified Micromonospora TaxID=2617518 RepID=UPI0033E62C80